MNFKKTVWVVIAATATLATIFLYKRHKIPPPGSSVTKITIAQWGQAKYLIYLPVYIAQEKGFFKKRGLEVSIVFSGNDNQVFATVARGDAQFGVGDPTFAAISRQRGFDGVVVASIVDRVALWGVTKSDRSFKSPVDFARTTIGTFPRPSTTYTLVKQMIEKDRIPGARIVQVAIGNELALLESGQADVVMMLEPAASIAESKGYHIATSFPKLWGPFAFTGLTSTQSYVKTHPKVVNSVRAALADALTLLHQRPAEAIAVAQKLFPNLDPKILANAVNRMLRDGTIPTNVNVSREGWLRAIGVRQSMGDLKKGSEYLQCIDWK